MCSLARGPSNYDGTAHRHHTAGRSLPLLVGDAQIMIVVCQDPAPATFVFPVYRDPWQTMADLAYQYHLQLFIFVAYLAGIVAQFDWPLNSSQNQNNPRMSMLILAATISQPSQMGFRRDQHSI